MTRELPNVTGGVVDVGQEVLVHGELSDNGGVSELRSQGLALRGEPDFGTDTAVVRFQQKVVSFDPTVTDSLVQRFLGPEPSDSAAGIVLMIATATDARGNVGADTVALTLEAGVDPSEVNITEAAGGISRPLFLRPRHRLRSAGAALRRPRRGGGRNRQQRHRRHRPGRQCLGAGPGRRCIRSIPAIR